MALSERCSRVASYLAGFATTTVRLPISSGRRCKQQAVSWPTQTTREAHLPSQTSQISEAIEQSPYPLLQRAAPLSR